MTKFNQPGFASLSVDLHVCRYIAPTSSSNGEEELEKPKSGKMLPWES